MKDLIKKYPSGKKMRNNMTPWERKFKKKLRKFFRKTDAFSHGLIQAAHEPKRKSILALFVDEKQSK